MKRVEQDLLLRDSLGGSALEEVRARSLAEMLGAARSRRRRRRIISGAAASLLVVTAAMIVTHQRTPASSTVLPTPSRSNSVQTIDDQQLLALFADRSIALVGKSGDQELLFLDRSEPPLASRGR